MAEDQANEAASFIEKLKGAVPGIVSVETKTFGLVYMRRPSGADQARLLGLHRSLETSKAGGLPPAAVLAVSIMRSDGTPMFTDLMEGFLLLSATGSRQLDELFAGFLKISHLGAHALEDAEKKSLSGQSSESGTG